MPAAVESMMYTKTTPWHGLGEYVGDYPVLSEEAIVAAGLDWEVEKCPAFAILDDGTTEHEVEALGHYFNVRTSDKRVLGRSVQETYSVLQNREAFTFMDTLAGPSNLVRYHTAGSLHNGSHIWLLAEVTGLTLEPVPGDVTEPYILLVNGHDGRMPLKALFTSVRVVCQNTLNLALSSSTNGVTIRHTGDMTKKVAQARKVLGFATVEFKKYSELAETLVKKRMGDKVLKTFLDNLVPLRNEEDTRNQNIRDTLVELFEAGPGSDIPGVRGTAWGALNAVTDYTAHHRTTRGAGEDPLRKREKRLQSVWFGSGNSLNQKALRLLVDA